MWKRSIGRSPGSHSYSKQDMKHAGWCLRNNISVCVSPHWEGTAEEWRVEIKINKNLHLDPKVYKADEAHVKMYEYYKYYYDKYNK